MCFTHKGIFIRRSAETVDKRLAERIYHKVRAEVEEGKWFSRPPGEDILFSEMMEKYMAEHSVPKKSSSERDRYSLGHLLPFFGGFTLCQITPKLINEYKTGRMGEGTSPASINRELALLRHAFSLAVREWEWVSENPVKKISMEREAPSRDRWLTLDEEERLLNISPPWLKEVLIFGLETGCRREEMLSLEWKDVAPVKKSVTIRTGKTAERRVVPLTRRALEVIQQREQARSKVRPIMGDYVFTHPAGKKVNIHTLRWTFERNLERAGIADFRFHDLRHTFASRLAQAGVDPYTIQKLMGHKSFSTTQRYAHHYTESLRRGISALDCVRQEKPQESITILSQ